MRPALTAALVLMLPFTALPAWADAVGEDTACINETSRQFGVAAFAIKVLDHSPSFDGALVTLDLSGQIVTCNVTSGYEVLEVSSGDNRLSATAEGWQEGCIAAAAAAQGVQSTDVAIGDNIGGMADMLVLGGQPMVCRIAPDGTVQGVEFR